MSNTLPPLPGLQAFEATARLGSITAAADELHLSPSAVSQRLRTVETHLGVTLFERRARSVRLTAMGRAYLPTVRAAFDDLAVGTAGLFGPSTRRRLTVRVQISYAATWLMPRLQDFHDQHPDVDLRVINAIWADVVPPDEVDLEIRHGSGSWDGFTTDLLHEDHAVIVASPAHLETYGPLTDGADLHNRPRVHILGYDDLWQRLFPHSAPAAEQKTSATITLDTSIAATQFAASGQHCALVPERFARTAVRGGQLVLLHDRPVPMRQAHYLLQREGTPQLSPEARAFVQWLIRQDIEDPPLQPVPPQ